MSNSTGSVPITNTVNSQDNGIDGTLETSGTSGYVASWVIPLTYGSHAAEPENGGDGGLYGYPAVDLNQRLHRLHRLRD